MDRGGSTGKKLILGIASIAAAAGYPLYSRSQRELAAKSFKIEKEGDLLLGETVVRFAFLVFEQSIPEYLNRIIKYREDRRKQLDNPKQYGKLLLEFREDMFQIKLKMEAEMLDILKIPKNIWEMSVVKEADNDSLKEFYLNYPALIKSQFKSEKAIEHEELIKILKDLHEAIEQEDKSVLVDLVNSVEDPTLAQTLLESWAYDVVQGEYGHEEEDIVTAMNEYIAFDPQIALLNKSFYQIIRKSIKKIKRGEM